MYSINPNYQNGILTENEGVNSFTSTEIVQKTIDSVSKTVNGTLPVKNGQTIRNKFTEGKIVIIMFFVKNKKNKNKTKVTQGKLSIALSNLGLDFDSIKDWTCELRPSMKKLRQAMDGLLKTARLTHSIFRVQEDRRTALRFCNVRYRRDVCFSQAVSFYILGVQSDRN